MKKFLSIKFRKLRNEAHYQFLVICKELIIAKELIPTITAQTWDAFLDLLDKERILLDADRSSDFTWMLSDASNRIDRNLIGISSAITSGMHHYNPNVAEAARSLHERFHDFKDITRKPYEEKIAAVSILLDAFNVAYAAQVATLFLQGWLTDLTEAHAEFQDHYMQRSAQAAARSSDKFIDIRNQIEKLYRLITGRIDAASIIEPTPAIENFINLLNAQIMYFNEHAYHKPKKAITSSTCDVIPPQPFNEGLPVTPLPVVHVDDQLLAFTKDYTVSYRNNRNRGTATLVITGKGGYAGKREITFNIE